MRNPERVEHGLTVRSEEERASCATVSMRRIALVLVALLAFACHGFITQTHVHLPLSAASPALAGADGQQLKVGQGPGKAPADCPICREYVQAGHYLPSVPVVFDAVTGPLAWLFVPLFVAWHGRGRSHAWRSRGPPLHRTA